MTAPALFLSAISAPFIVFVPLVLLGLAGTVFWIVMLVDCARRLQAGERDKLVWLVVMVFTHAVGALIYLLAGRGSSASGGSPGGMTAGTIALIALGVLVGLPLLLALPQLALGAGLFAFGGLSVAFWIWMLVDCAMHLGTADDRNRTPFIIWLLVILFTGIGALIYFFVEYLGKTSSTLKKTSPSPNPFTPFQGGSPFNNPPPPPAASASPAPSAPPPVSPQPTHRVSGQCPKCGAPLGPDAPEGLCPRCLLQMNLGAPTQFPGVSAASFASTTPPPPPPAPEEIAKHFPQLEILECLGRGGMGVVYKARQPRLNRLVALKVLAPGRQEDPQFAERFLREAQALARLNHPNIVTVFDFGESDGLFYLMMEYVDGVTLRGLLQGGKVESLQALAIVPRICEALQYAHEQGVVHRDIKPENVLIDKQGRVKIADFGIARMLGVEGQPAHTRDRYVIGTPYYMAPEQVERPLEVDHRADIYSLGVVFYEMLTGELPLGRFALPSQKVTVDVRLDDVVLRALEKEPQRRYQQAGQVKSDVETISGGGAGNLAAAVAAPPHMPTPPRQPTGGVEATPPPIAPRFSLRAILGLVWAVAGVVAFGFVANDGGPKAVLVLAPLLCAPLGTTVLGWMAVSDILHARGKIYGLWLAVVDGLLFPLAAVDGLIAFLCYLAATAIAGSRINQSPRDIAMYIFATVVLSLLADVVIIWLAVGAVRQAHKASLADTASSNPSPPDVSEAELMAHMPGLALRVIGCVDFAFAIFGAGLAILSNLNFISLPIRPLKDINLSEMWSIPFAVSVGQVLIAALCGFLIMRGGRMLQLLRNHGSASFGAVVAVVFHGLMIFTLPARGMGQFGWLVSVVAIGVGLWALVVLNRQAVLAAYSAKAAYEAVNPRSRSSHVGWVTALACVILLTGLGVCLAVWNVSRNTTRRIVATSLPLPPVSDAELLRAQKLAELTQQQYQAGVIPAQEMINAAGNFDVLKAQAAGSRQQMAQIQLDWARKLASIAESQFKAGLITQSEFEEVQTKVGERLQEYETLVGDQPPAQADGDVIWQLGAVPPPLGYARPAPAETVAANVPAAPAPPGQNSPAVAGLISVVAGQTGVVALPPGYAPPAPSAAQASVASAMPKAAAPDVTLAEITAIEKLDYENNRLDALFAIAHRASLSAEAQVRLVQSAYHGLTFENNKVALLREIIKRADLAAAARAEIIAQLNSLDFDNNRLAVLKMLNLRSSVSPR